MSSDSAGYACGFTSHLLDDTTRARPVAADLWYPAAAGAVEAAHDYGLGTGRTAVDAAPATGPFPVLVLSHGAFGAARNYAWLAEYLSRRGTVLCGVSHYRESYLFGPRTIDPAAAMQVADRAQDCSFALDHVLRESRLAGTVDAARIGALGHSSGGATVAALLGGVFEPPAMRAYCVSSPPGTDRGCGYGSAAPPGEGEDREPSVRAADPRIRAGVLLDPALGPGFQAESLAALTVPVHVVGSVENDFLPVEHHAARYARLIPTAAYTPLDGGEGHFVYLNTCDTVREANGVPLCRDRHGVDRDGVHRRLAPLIADFFDAALSHPAGSGG